MLSELSDEELIEQLRAHYEAFEELYKRYSQRLFAYFYKRVPAEDAQDLTQRCVMRIYDKAHTFNSNYPAAAWIFTLARNLLNDEYRRRGRELKLNEAYALELEQVEEVSGQEVWAALQEDLGNLDQRQREIIVWRYFEGREFDEIAKNLATTPSNARQLVSRAIRSLKKKVMEHEDEKQ